MNLSSRALVAGLVCMLSAGSAWAHPGHGEPDFVSGLLHPLTGLDHLLAMLAIGLWAGWRRSAPHLSARASLALPGLFVMGAALGTGLGLAGLFGPSIEIAVAASLLPLGAVLLLRWVGPDIAALPLALVCGTLHGAAHGAELAGLGTATAITGFLLGTTLLHAAGLGAALTVPQRFRGPAMASAGSGIAAAGLWLLA